MLIICDYRLPVELKSNLKAFGEVIDFRTKGIVYEAISGHPDIFFHKAGNTIVYAPNTPQFYIELLKSTNSPLVSGVKPLGMAYPKTVYYNAVAIHNHLYCHAAHIDSAVIAAHSQKEVFHLNQGYVACNMVVGSKTLLTSDKGISKALDGQYLPPSNIRLKGVSHGFIGGSCHVFQDKLLLFGSLNYISESAVIEGFARDNSLQIVELYAGPLVDGGGLLMVNS